MYARLSSQLVFQLKNKIFSIITKIVTKDQDWNLDFVVKDKVFGGMQPERISGWHQSTLKYQLYLKRDIRAGPSKGRNLKPEIWEAGEWANGQPQCSLSRKQVPRTNLGLRNERWLNSIISTRLENTMLFFSDLPHIPQPIPNNARSDKNLIMIPRPE